MDFEDFLRQADSLRKQCKEDPDQFNKIIRYRKLITSYSNEIVTALIEARKLAADHGKAYHQIICKIEKKCRCRYSMGSMWLKNRKKEFKIV